MSMNICEDCKHYAGKSFGEHVCSYPRTVQATITRSKEDKTYWRWCDIERQSQSTSRCGYRGRFYEPKVFVPSWKDRFINLVKGAFTK